MRDPERDPGRLEHILMAIDKIEEYTDGISYDQLTSDSMRMHAVIYNIQIVGEATYKLTREYKATHTTVPWILMEKMRHVLVHDYYKIVPEAVWDVVKSDLPAVKPEIQRLLSKSDTE